MDLGPDTQATLSNVPPGYLLPAPQGRQQASAAGSPQPRLHSRCADDCASYRRAHVGGGRRVEGRRARGASRLRSAADLREERKPWGHHRSIPAEVRRSAGALTRPASRRWCRTAAISSTWRRRFRRSGRSRMAAFIDELDRAQALGLSGVVIHPGTCTAGTEDGALRLIAEGISAAFKARPRRKTMVLLEHTAGQGRTRRAIGSSTCGDPRASRGLAARRRVHRHVSSRRVRLRHRQPKPDIEETFEAFDRLVGFDRVKVFHGNDSKKPCGSRVDRHEHIGEGCLGLEPFRRMMHDPRFAGLPMLIETEKSPMRGKAALVVCPTHSIPVISRRFAGSAPRRHRPLG